MFIDFSQYKLFSDCEWKWYERCVLGSQRAPKPGQQDTPLVLGSLVHEGLRTLTQQRRVEIPQATIAQHNPSPECVASAYRLLLGYSQQYPEESSDRTQFGRKKFYCEAPLRFPLDPLCEGLARVDQYFHCDEPQEIQDGRGGTLTLSPGWWIYEHKTKKAETRMGNWIESWRTCMQADFQLHALAHHIGDVPQGLIINVLEKPKIYEPVRTCKACKQRQEFAEYLVHAMGYECPQCHAVQEFDPPKPKAPDEPKYYRVQVTRSISDLERSIDEIRAVSRRMLALAQGGQVPLRATERCVDLIWGRCEYWEPHSTLSRAQGWNGFVQIQEPLAYATN